MNALTSCRSAVHSGTSFGSKIAHRRLVNSDCSMNKAMRRTATYFHCSYAGLSDTSVRAPKTTLPIPGNVRMQLTPSGLRTPCCGSVSAPHGTTPVVPRIVVSSPAGDFQTPRLLSSCAKIPATKPLGGEVAAAPVTGSVV